VRTRRKFAFALALAAPLVIVLTVAYGVAAGEEGPSVQVAQGASGGAFHPVAGNFIADDTSLDECDGDYSCLQQAFGNVTYREGARKALTLFDKQIASNEFVRADCHRIAHVIGSAAFARYEESVAKTFALGSSTCASGYYHGILERAFVGVTTKAKLVEVARELCADSGVRRRGFLDYQCQHGLGHGLMIQTGYDLPLSLSTCAELRTRWDDVVCTGGVFMENVTTRFGFRSSWLSDDDPLYPCERVAQQNRRSCYLRAAVRVISFHENDFGKSAQTCLALETRWAEPCMRGIGRDVVGAARYAPAKILSLCALGGGGEGDCLYGAARTVGDGFGVPGAKRAARLCARAPLAHRESCFSGVGIVVGLLYATDAARRAACTAFAPEHADACAAVAIAEVRPDGREAWG
jgi:hypothetical protein